MKDPIQLKNTHLFCFIPAFLTLLLLLAVSTSCYYDSEEYLFPEIGLVCDTTQVSFTQSVRGIIENNCFSCHSNATAASFGGNIRLQDYADVKARADDGKLLGSISHAQGFIPMPMGALKLNDCSIHIIKKWIDNGALNE